MLTALVGVLACGMPSPVKTVDIHIPSRDADADTVEASVVPPDSAMPGGALGTSIRRGRALLEHTHDSLPRYAPSNLRCVSCHLDDGRRVDGAPLLGVYARYPRFVDRTGAVVSIEDRVNYCFTRSLAGRRLPATSRQMQDIVSYLAFLSTGVPTGAHVRGEGMPRMPKLVGDTARGATLYVANCLRCHAIAGGGGPVPASIRGPNTPAFAPALWGPRSFSIGAGLARGERAAAFIRTVMPYDAPGTLTDQQAYDLAAFVLSHPRPDQPGKANDWPAGDAPADVPYATRGHRANHLPALIRRMGDTADMMVPAPPPVSGVAVQARRSSGKGRRSGSTHAARAVSDMSRSRE
jgi:thiosulfate dehydrogenase